MPPYYFILNDFQYNIVESKPPKAPIKAMKAKAIISAIIIDIPFSQSSDNCS